jgi:two-component system OmpR family response regulator
MHVLIVEDDSMLAEALSAGLGQLAWSSEIASDAVAAQLALVEHHFSAILLDLQLPGASGLSVLTRLRSRYDATPVLIITARDALSDRIKGLDAGADDYIVKPFEPDELFARLRAVVRRAQGRTSAQLRASNVVLDPGTQSVVAGGVPVELSLHEYRTLLALMERPGRVVTREQLEASVYGDAGAIQSNAIAVYVHQLRKKLGDELIKTVPGFGYRVGAP